MTIKRHPDWEARLSAFIATCDDIRFEWGVCDCAMFAATAIERMTGFDIAADFRGQYYDGKGAAQALREHGAGTLQKTVTATLGKPHHIARAKRGDIVMHNGSLGVCAGSFSLFVGALDLAGQMLNPDEGEGGRGLIPIPTRLCAKAWTVPF